MKIRIGNDFHVAWSIYRVYSGSYIVEDLEVAKNVKVVLRNNFMYNFIPDITIDGNIISFEVPTDKQQLGTYTLELSYDLDDVSCADLLRHITLDRPAFTIVSSTYEGDAVVDNINLTSAFVGGKVTMAIDANHELIATYINALTDDYTINSSGELILTY